MSQLNITEDLFIDRFELTLSKHNQGQLQRYIDKYEQIYVEDLLGCDLANLFFADLVDGIPQTQRFIDIWERFCIDEKKYYFPYQYYYNQCGGIVRSEGMVNMLVALIYSQYLKDQKYPNTIQGNIQTDPENAQQVSFNRMGWYIRQNEGIDSYLAIQTFICNNKTSYEEYNGQPKRYVSWL